MSPERKPERSNVHEQEYEIQLGIGFKPFKGIRDFYRPPKNETFYIPEDYDYRLLLRRNISLRGIDGFIDIISEDPKSFIDQLAAISKTSKYRAFIDQPFGWMMTELAYHNGKVETVNNPAILRFSFLLNNPSQYIKLLNTYGMVHVGSDEFLLSFNLNQLIIKRGLEKLEQGKRLLVGEKNLFSIKKIEEIARKNQENSKGKDLDLSDTDSAKPPPNKSHKDPGRISFVELPNDIKKLRTIGITFHGLDDWDKPEEYPSQPLQPNLQPIPVLA